MHSRNTQREGEPSIGTLTTVGERMPCPLCEEIERAIRFHRQREQKPVIRRETFESAIPRLLGFDVREPEWHDPDAQLRDLVGTHKVVRKAKRKLTSKQKRRSKKMSRAMSKVNRKARKKDGSLKKGWTQQKIMKEAHKEAGRMK